MAKVLVTGGSGVLGRVLAPLLHSEGHDVTVLTRRPDAQLPGGVRRIVGDLASGAGLDAAVRDAGVVVHLATSPFRPVLAAGSGLPFTIQRATQFHDLVLVATASAARAPVLLVPSGTSCQPVDAADVARRLAEIVRTGPVNGLAADLGGPQILDAAHLARDVVAAIGARRPVRPIWIPGRVGAGFRAGHHLAASTPRGARTWRSYLEDRCRAEPGVLPLPYSGRRVPIRRR